MPERSSRQRSPPTLIAPMRTTHSALPIFDWASWTARRHTTPQPFRSTRISRALARTLRASTRCERPRPSSSTTQTVGGFVNLERPPAPDPYTLLPKAPSFAVQSKDVRAGAPIDEAYIYAGGNRSPELSWSDVPRGTKSFV